MTSSPYAGTKVLSVGGSRNIGYFASIRLLEKGATVTFLLRSGPTVFDKNTTIQKYVKSGKARLIKGDALNKEDVKKAWEEAAKGEGWVSVGILLFTVGGTPKFKLGKGFTISPPNIVTQSLLNVISTHPASFSQPKIIILSSTGLTKSSHSNLPFIQKPLYKYLLKGPHSDKVGVEKIVSHCAGWEWKDGDAKNDILSKGDEWKEGLPATGTLKSVIVIRPALLTDGECKADKLSGKDKEGEAYRVKEGDIGGYSVSRKDVAHFIVEGVLTEWKKWEEKCVSIAY